MPIVHRTFPPFPIGLFPSLIPSTVTFSSNSPMSFFPLLSRWGRKTRAEGHLSGFWIFHGIDRFVKTLLWTGWVQRQLVVRSGPVRLGRRSDLFGFHFPHLVLLSPARCFYYFAQVGVLEPSLRYPFADPNPSHPHPSTALSRVGERKEGRRRDDEFFRNTNLSFFLISYLVSIRPIRNQTKKKL